jgi:hypothetical protein
VEEEVIAQRRVTMLMHLLRTQQVQVMMERLELKLAALPLLLRHLPLF